MSTSENESKNNNNNDGAPIKKDDTPNVTVTVLPGCTGDPMCMLIEIELTATKTAEHDSTHSSSSPAKADDEDEEAYNNSQLVDPSETDSKRIAQIKRWRTLSVHPNPTVMTFALDHATNEILDACLTTSGLKPFDETVTLTLEQLKKEKEAEEERQLLATAAAAASIKTETSNDDNKSDQIEPGAETKNNDTDADHNVESDSASPVTAVADETSSPSPSSSPPPLPPTTTTTPTVATIPTIPSPPVRVSTKTKPHAPCLLLRGDYKLQAQPGALGVGMHPIHVAALCGNLKALQDYVEKYGVDALRVRTEDDRDIVEYAIRGLQMETLKFLVGDCKLPFDKPNGIGSTCLMIVCFNPGKKSNEMAKYLLENFSTEELNVHFAFKDGECALVWALMGCNWCLADLLMEKHQAKLPEVLDRVAFMQSLSTRGNVEGLRYFVEKLGVRLDYVPRTLDSLHPMILPSQAKTEEAALAILEVLKPLYIEQVMTKEGYDEDFLNIRKKDPTKTYDLTPLHFAARQGYAHLTKELHDMGLATTDEQLQAVSNYVGSAFLYAMTPLAVSNVILYLLYLGVNPAHNDLTHRTSMISRIVYWDGRSATFKGRAKETDPWLRWLTFGDEFHCLLVHLIKDRKLLTIGITSGEGPLHNPTPESLRREQDQILAHARKYRRADRFAQNRNFLPFQGTLVDPQFTSASCTLVTGLAFIDLGLDYANTRVMSVVGNSSQHTLRFHELKVHWLRYYYYFLGGGGFSTLACGGSTSDDLSWASNPQTVHLACKVLLENGERIEQQEREAERIKGFTKAELAAYLAEKKSQKKTDLAEEYVDRKHRQIVSCVRYYKAHTTALGRIMSCQSSLKSGAGGGLMMSWDGIVLYLQDRISAWIVGFVHQKSTTLLRNPNRWSSQLERFMDKQVEHDFFVKNFFAPTKTTPAAEENQIK